MAKKPEQSGHNNKRLHVQEGYVPQGRKGYNAATQTSNRKPPQGGSGTAPPKNVKK